MTNEQYSTTSTGVNLYWNRFVPTSSGAGPWPAALVLHPGGFKAGIAGPDNVAKDLADAGILAFTVEYRLSPPHSAMNFPNHLQPAQNTVAPVDDGHYPSQTDDVRSAILKARVDIQCNGLVYCVGGSAGASHSLYWAARGTAGADRPDLAVLCSGVYQFDDEAHLKVNYPPGETNYHSAITNYLNIPDPFPNGPWDMAALHDASPKTYITRNLPPVFALTSSDDAGGVDKYQFPDLINGLKAAGITESLSSTPRRGRYKKAVIPVTTQTHAFKYWSNPISVGNAVTVRDAVITWLSAGPPP